VAVRVDEAGHERQALRVDPLRAGHSGRGGRRDRRDLAVLHHDRAALDHAAFAVDHTRVDDDEVLRGCRRRKGKHVDGGL